MWNIFATLFIVHSVLLSLVLAQVQLRVVRQWKYLNYTWPNEDALQMAMAQGLYIPENIVASGIMYYDDWFYLAMPRMRGGVPATLGRITAHQGGSTAPLIAPFPSWDFNKEGDCTALQNVQNVEIDTKGQMWIIDGGHTGSLTPTPVKNCPPKLIIFDIKTNTTTLTYVFPETVASKNSSFLYDVVVDGDYAYITDNSAHDPGIVVFSRQQNRSWKIRHSQTMRADTSAQHFVLNSVPIAAPINIAGIALGPKITGGNAGIVVNEDREVFYCPLSSLHLYSISTSILCNESNANNGMDYPGEVRDVGVKASQTDGMLMTNQGVLYYGLLADNSIAKWDTRTPFASAQKVVSRDSLYIQWTNAFTMDLQGNLTVLTDTLQKFIYEKLDLNKPNFWLLSAHVDGKSYLYDDSSYDYNSMADNNTHIAKITTTTTSKPPMEVTSQPTPQAVPFPVTDTIFNKTVATDNNVKTNNPRSPGGANHQVLELSIIIASAVVWLLHNF